MAEEKREANAAAAQIPLPPYNDVNAKWDACMDLSIRRVFYSTAVGAFTGLLLLRSPVTRWASVAFAAGIGVGSAYIECSYKFGGSAATLTPNLSEAPLSKDVED
ncbi:hypothetical protein ACH5RR_026202 [Cinchona calisaya]|uniref:Uncharacterized protein n=1 Tax=Cinchona calisaya TaxID=153742 RepID=A0ABD2Z1V7_9GENT